MVTTSRCSLISRTVLVLGTAISMPDCSTGAVIMKITSSTSTTSTRGVMLMSARELWVRPRLLVKATFYLVGRITARQLTAAQFASLCGGPGRRRGDGGPCMNLLERIQQFAAEVINRRSKDPHPRRELVVGHHGRHGHKQPGGSRNQRFGNARRHGAQRGRARGSQSMECVHHADDRSEQAH